jgi:hypothetical protein
MRRARDLPSGSLPVVSLGSWHVLDSAGVPVPGVIEAESPEHAVTLALGLGP